MHVLCNRNGTAAEGITLLGAAFCSHSHICSHFSQFVSKTESILLSLKDLADTQIAFQLQRYSASTCLVSHLFRCTPPGLFKKISVSTRDSIIREGFADMHAIPLAQLQPRKFSWTQASLPIQRGGLWLIPASRVADADYVGSDTNTSEISSVLTEAI